MSKQNYAVCCYTCEHNGQETCKGCNTILNGGNEPYENWQLKEDLCRKDKQIADLQHKLKVTEIVLNKMSNYVINDNDLYDLFLTVRNIGYRVASYNVKQKRVILNMPEIWVPEKGVLEKFVEYVNQATRGNKNV